MDISTGDDVIIESAGIRWFLEKCKITHVCPPWDTPTQNAQRTVLQAQGHKLHPSNKACDLIASSVKISKWELYTDSEATMIPSAKHVSDHVGVIATLDME
jgi:hypothetical protein